MADPSFRYRSAGIQLAGGEWNRRFSRKIMLGSLALAVVCLPASFLIHGGFLVIFTLCLIVSGIAAGVAGGWRSERRGRQIAGDVAIERGLLVLEMGIHRREYPLDDIAQGWLEAPNRVGLRLRDGREILARVPDDEAGMELLKWAGVSPTERTLQASLASAASRIPGGEIVGVLGMLLLTPLGILVTVVALQFVFAYATQPSGGRAELIGWLAQLAVGAGLLAVVGGMYRFMLARQVVLGTDGVAFHGLFGRKFIPYSQIEGASRHGHGVELGLRGGETFLLPVRAWSLGALPLTPPAGAPPDPSNIPGHLTQEVYDYENQVHREVLLRRVQQGMAARGGSTDARAALNRLERKTRAFSAWRGELRRLLDADGDYRQSRIAPEDLLAVVEDPAARPERRIGAAIALSTAADEHTQRRIRVAVHACADDDLRAALEEAARGEAEEARIERLKKRFVE